MSGVTVGIVTRNRPESLRRCLASLAALGDALAEIVVVDDHGDVPLDDVLRRAPAPIRFIRQPRPDGYIVARNRIVRDASTEIVLLMDDDAALLPDGNALGPLALFRAHPGVALIACAMAEPDGSLWHVSMQPAPVDYTCCVASHIGFAHFIRRSVFLEVGGYRESFFFYGEEKDLCVRMLQAGYHVVYMPHVRVVHDVDPTGRSASRYVRYVVRNDCLFALYNEPWPLLLVSLPVRLLRFFPMTRGRVDRGGFLWIVKELVTQLPAVFAGRRAVSWATVRQWRRLARTWPAFA
jgi:GT2 family glycosyltransferase